MAQELSFADVQVTSSEIEVRKIHLSDLRESLRLGYQDYAAKPSTGLFLVFIYPLFALILSLFLRGNNLLYLLLAMLLFLLVLQNVLAEWHFRGLSLERRLPGEAFAREGAAGAVWVSNHVSTVLCIPIKGLV